MKEVLTARLITGEETTSVEISGEATILEMTCLIAGILASLEKETGADAVEIVASALTMNNVKKIKERN